MASGKRLIDANALIEKKRKYCSGHGECDYMVELWHIENAPTVDAVEVVRCKDCKHWHEGTGWCDQHSYFEEDEWNMLDADDFCSYGERREDNANL